MRINRGELSALSIADLVAMIDFIQGVMNDDEYRVPDAGDKFEILIGELNNRLDRIFPQPVHKTVHGEIEYL